jgi:hypothetical protein
LFVIHQQHLKRKSERRILSKGKKLTGFSNTEEAAVGLTDVVPFF